MRPDSIGLFWQDIPTKGDKNAITRVMPDIPETGWRAPKEFPRLDGAPWLSVDTEGYDPHLTTHGPGWARKDGHIIGLSVAAPGKAWYFPFRHEVRPEENLDPVHVIAWARDTFKAHGKRPVMGANLMYDVGWLQEEGIYIEGTCYDVQFAEALLEEAALTNLDNLTKKYIDGPGVSDPGLFVRHKGHGKSTEILYQWLADYYGGPPTEKQKKNFYRCPPSLIGPYAEGDADYPARILPLQWERLHREGLVDIFEMESRLIPLLVAMRRVGVTIDIPRAERVSEELGLHVKGLEKQLDEMVGAPTNTAANESLQKAFQRLGIPIPIEASTGKPSFTKDTLTAVEHPIGELILTIRKRAKVKSTFIDAYLLEKHVNGKIHCSIHPLRGDAGGTRAGRFSMSNPNGQNIPSRDEELAPMVRGCFIPDPGHKRWRRYDYDQVEYRELANFAVGPGSDTLRQQYITHPETDYHVNTQALVTRFTGLEIPRKPIKNLNFGMTFGMGRAKMITSLTTELKKMGGKFTLNGDELYNAYHEACPWTRETLDHYSQQALSIGFVRTILGRRSRFDLWEPDARRSKDEERLPALPYAQALARYGKIKRAYSHKALNRVLQGSAADTLKMAMLKMWDSGVFNYTGVPRLTIHDELDFSDPLENENDEAWDFIKRTMETSIPHRIPIVASLDLGINWGACT